MHKYGLILLLTNIPENVKKAQEIYSQIWNKNPTLTGSRFNQALTYCFFEDFDSALLILRELKMRNFPINFADPYLSKISVVRKSEIDGLR